jgi:Fe-S cluster assembly protein SufD
MSAPSVPNRPNVTNVPNVPNVPNVVVESYREQFLEHAGRFRGREPAWLSLLRGESFERFLDTGFPTTDEEDWRFTSVAALAATSFSLGSLARGRAKSSEAVSLLHSHALTDWKRHELVFVNGVFAQELSSIGKLPQGVVVTNLTRALESHAEEVDAVLGLPPAEGTTVFADLNRAFLEDGAFVYVPEGILVEEPIHLVFLTSVAKPAVSHPHNLVMVERRGEARIVESYLGVETAEYFTNAVTEIVAGGGASIDHYKIQREGLRAYHLSSQRLLEARSSRLQDMSLSLGAKLARNDIHTLLDGEGSDLTLNGLYVVRGTQHVDHHTVIDHKAAHCTSRELYKGVLDDTSSGVFNGRIIVRPDAQKTNARQSNKNLLLSEEALVNSNPQLEINADDVKCAHGATIGQLDKDALFYLRSRGIAYAEARQILTRAFMAEVSEQIRIDALRDAMRGLVLAEAAA